MNVGKIKNTRFLSKEDAGTGIIVTLDHVEEGVDIGTDEQPKQGFVLHFLEELKPMVLGPTVATQIAEILQCDDTEGWRGRQIILFADMSIMFGGKRVGGLRARALPPEQSYQPVAQHAPPPQPAYRPQPPPQGRPPAPAGRPPAPAPTQPYRAAAPAPAYRQAAAAPAPAIHNPAMDFDPGDAPPWPADAQPAHPGGPL